MQRVEALETRCLMTTIQLTALAELSTDQTGPGQVSEFASVGDKLYFDLDDKQIWVTDGSQGGTHFLTDGDLTARWRVKGVAGNSRSVFEVSKDGENAVWISDGTPDGTSELTKGSFGQNIIRIQQPLNVRFDVTLDIGSSTIFEAGNSTWLSTTEATVLIAPGRVQTSYELDAGHVFTVEMSNGESTWFSDGTVGGTFQIADGWLGLEPIEESGLVFVTTRQANQVNTVSRTDGTPQGTFELISGHHVAGATTANGVIYLDLETELHRTVDGTPGNLEFVADKLPGGLTSTSAGVFFFAENEAEEAWLWKLASDSNAAPQAVFQIAGERLQSFNDRVLFFEQDPDAGITRNSDWSWHLWGSDGTSENTQQLLDHHFIFPQDRAPKDIERIPMGDSIVFSVSTGPVGSASMFATDGTPSGTFYLEPVHGEVIDYFGVARGRHYFGVFTSDASPRILSTDGSDLEIESGALCRCGAHVTIDEHETVRIRISGHPGGETIIDEEGKFQIEGTGFYSDIATYQVNDAWYYQMSGHDRDELPWGRITREPFSRDVLPLENDTVAMNPGVFNSADRMIDSTVEPRSLFVLLQEDQTKRIVAFDGGVEPLPVLELGINNPEWALGDGALFFTNQEAEFGSEVWASDGSEATVVDLNPGPASSNPSLFGWQDKTLVVADTPDGGRTLYQLRVLENSLGDANGDGDVDFADFLVLSQNFGKTDQAFADGDFDGNGLVDFADFLVLADSFATTVLESAR